MNKKIQVEERALLKGAHFVIEDADPRDIFTPEDFTDEHRMIRDTAIEFMEREVLPQTDRFEQQDYDLIRELMRKCGELGLLSVDIPEKYGGLGLDKVSSIIVAEAVGRYASFAVTHGGHTGIGTMPIVFFGSEASKQKYLPRLASGEWIAAYALTEPEAGSDALSIRTLAKRSDDGKFYTLSGSKIWITNGGFANVFTVFAKVDGEKMSAFIVERDFPGVSIGAEEKKLGIKGSSTTTVNLEDARVPAENLLGEEGIGGKIALNILNIGRYKLGASCAGGMKAALALATRYALERKQFQRPIAEFGAIQEKLAHMTARAWAGESMVYRTAGLLDRALADADAEDPRDLLKRIEDYAVECSIVKVALSEFMDYVADETVQIFGGYGYSAEYPAERVYRDARINRIFEGTNEINRLVITGMLLRKVQKGRLDLMKAIAAVQKDILMPLKPGFAEEPWGRERALIQQMKKIFLILAGKAYERFLDKLMEEQELVFILSDLLIDIYAAESSLLRAMKHPEPDGELKRDLVRVLLQDVWANLDRYLRDAVGILADGDERRALWGALRKYQYAEPENVIAARRRIARVTLDRKGYPLSG